MLELHIDQGRERFAPGESVRGRVEWHQEQAPQ